MSETPNPGSQAALDAGCQCPVMDNRHGRGAYSIDGVPQFWHNADCPIHREQANAMDLRPEDVE